MVRNNRRALVGNFSLFWIINIPHSVRIVVYVTLVCLFLLLEEKVKGEKTLYSHLDEFRKRSVRIGEYSSNLLFVWWRRQCEGRRLQVFQQDVWWRTMGSLVCLRSSGSPLVSEWQNQVFTLKKTNNLPSGWILREELKSSRMKFTLFIHLMKEGVRGELLHSIIETYCLSLSEI